MNEVPTENPVIPPIEFVSTVQMLVDAYAMHERPRMNAYHVLADLVIVVGGLGFGLAGYPVGYLASIFGALLLVFSHVDAFQRWRFRHYRSLTGRRVTIEFDAMGLRTTSDLATTRIPWSTLTEMRSNERSTVFLRGRLILVHIPASAFTTSVVRAQAIQFARDHIARSTAAS